ncbi:glycoprotease family-domain-containing protein [Nemania abortiva]|nr:glycoprotease family-domain-containing protein [Nemania abortiva]
MSTLWKTPRQCLPGGSLFPRRAFSLSPARLSPLLVIRPHFRFPSHHQQPRRQLLTLAIETSCDDTCVAILEKDDAAAIARLHFHEKITSDNRAFGGVHPLTAVVSHTTHLALLVRESLRALPRVEVEVGDANLTQDGSNSNGNGSDNGNNGKVLWVDGAPRRRPDFVSVTRGPGMASNLATGLATAKGLAVAWDVPLLAVNHMQAHALTPRLVGALLRGAEEVDNKDEAQQDPTSSREAGDRRRLLLSSPQFPFLSLLVSGGHTVLVRSRSLNDHAILADVMNIAMGDMLDKCARMILPAEVISADDSVSGMYGPTLEEFAFPGSKGGATSYNYEYTPPACRADEIRIFDSGRGWTLTPPLANWGKSEPAASTYEFAGLNGQIQKVMVQHQDMDVDTRKILARETMRLVFEHLTSRLIFALDASKDKSGQDIPSTEAEGRGEVKTVVLSGGVASNKFLRHVVRRMLDVRGYTDIEVLAPPVSLCTDNAAMIAWTAMEMYEEGWRSDLDVLPLRKWPLDPNAEGGGILGASGWYKARETKQEIRT